VQSAIAEGNATQCGYCTPGWVMQMYSLLQKNPTPSAEKVEQSFDGNLCRCTGYRPLLNTFGAFATNGSKCGGHVSAKTPAGLLVYTPTPLHFKSANGSVELYKVLTLAQYAEAASLIAAAGKKIRPLVANTSAGVIKYLQPQSTLEDGTAYVDVSEIPDFHAVTSNASGLTVGAAVTIERLIEALQSTATSNPSHGVIADHMLRIASVQIRAVASWTGNLMIAREFPKFDSDMVIALGAGTKWNLVHTHTHTHAHTHTHTHTHTHARSTCLHFNYLSEFSSHVLSQCLESKVLTVHNRMYEICCILIAHHPPCSQRKLHDHE
jgi:xanthine dehydrogenase/oxidase